MDWQFTALSKSLKAITAASDPACYIWAKDGSQHVLYRGTDGAIHELWYRHERGWQYGGAISAAAGAPADAPAAAGQPCGYAWEQDGTQHVLYRGADSTIHELWQRQGQKWQHAALSALVSSAPPAAGDPWGYAWQGDGTQHVIYAGADRQIHELWQRQGGAWQYGGALTAKVKGAAPAAGDPVGFAWEEDRTQHVVYRGQGNHVHELWQRQGGQWEYGGPLSHQAGAPAAVGEPACYTWAKDGTQHVVYTGSDHQVHELWLRKNSGWTHDQPVSHMDQGALPAGSPRGYVWEGGASEGGASEGGGTQHIVYRGADGQVHELWAALGRPWAYGGALSTRGGGPPAAGVPAGFAWDADRSQHVVYRDAQGGICELRNLRELRGTQGNSGVKP